MIKAIMWHDYIGHRALIGHNFYYWNTTVMKWVRSFFTVSASLSHERAMQDGKLMRVSIRMSNIRL